jgi:RNA polymerase sigma-70 factor (ECF subfamily)
VPGKVRSSRRSFILRQQDVPLPMVGKEIVMVAATDSANTQCGRSAEAGSASSTRRRPARDGGLSDEALFADYCSTGCQETFARLVQRYERELYNFLRRYLGNAELAEDVFQQTFLQVHLKRDSFRQERKLRPWIYRIAVNQAIDTLRRTRRHQAVSLNHAGDESACGGAMIDSLADPSAPPEMEMGRREDSEWSRRTVSKLPQRLRRVVELVYFRGFTHREAAEALAIPIGTVKSRVSAALDKMRRSWSERGRDACPVPAVG